MSKPKVTYTTPAGPRTFEEALRYIYEQRLRVMQERQRKYGPHNVQGAGDSLGDSLLGLAYRIRDKLARFKRTAMAMLAGDVPEEFVDETLQDTLVDLGNYSDIALMVKRGWWGLPMEEEPHAEEYCGGTKE